MQINIHITVILIIIAGHKESVSALSFSPDGTKLVSCSDDQSLKVIDLCTGTIVFSKCLIEKLKYVLFVFL